MLLDLLFSLFSQTNVSGRIALTDTSVFNVALSSSGGESGMINVYDIGDLIRLASVFTNLSNAAVDPTTVTVRISLPDGTVVVKTAPDVIKDSTGNYHYDYLITQRGNHYYRFEGTGTVQVTGEDTFRVRRSNVI